MPRRKQITRKTRGGKMAAKKIKIEEIEPFIEDTNTKKDSQSSDNSNLDSDSDSSYTSYFKLHKEKFDQAKNRPRIFQCSEFRSILCHLRSRLNEIKMKMDSAYGSDAFEKIFGTSDLVLLCYQLTDTLADKDLLDYVMGPDKKKDEMEKMNRRQKPPRPKWNMAPQFRSIYTYDDIDNLIRHLRKKSAEIKIKMRQNYGEKSFYYVFGSNDIKFLADELTNTYKSGKKYVPPKMRTDSTSESDFDETDIRIESVSHIEPEIKVEPEDAATSSKNGSSDNMDQVISQVYGNLSKTKKDMRTMFGINDVIFKKFFGSADVTQVTAMWTGLSHKRILKFVAESSDSD